MIHVLRNTLRVLTKKEKNRFNTGIILNFLVSIVDIGSLVILLFIINFYTQPNNRVELSFLPHWLLNRSSPLLIAVFFVLFSAKNFAAFLVFRSQYRFVYQVANRLSQDKLLSFFRGGYIDYISIDSASHVRRISYQPTDFCQHVVGGMQQIIIESMLVLLTITAIIFFNPELFLLLFVILLPPITMVFFILKKRLQSGSMQVKTNSERSLQYLHEALNSYVESNIYNRKSFFVSRYSIYQHRFNKYLSDSMIVQSMPHRIIEVFAVLGLFILIGVKQGTAATGTSSLVTIGAFMAAAYKIIPGIVRILNLSGQIRTYEFILKDLLSTQPIIESEKYMAASKIECVEFRNVGFSFSGRPMVYKLQFCLKKGDLLGITGKSGEGKTTMLNLLLGFLTPEDGEILINNRVADSADRQQFWPSISYVKQDTFLLHDTILQNITLEEANHDCNRLNYAIEASGLKEIIAYPEGLQKVITENGKNISGGQRQRIAIARALYKNTDMVILDEPFNELDESSEVVLLEHFKQLAHTGKLVILITHNKKSLSYCNKIISLDE